MKRIGNVEGTAVVTVLHIIIEAYLEKYHIKDQKPNQDHEQVLDVNPFYVLNV
jgi:hypothetical protein